MEPPPAHYDAAPGAGWIVDGPLEHAATLSPHASLAWTVVGGYVTFEVTLRHAGLAGGAASNDSLGAPASDGGSWAGAAPGWFGLAVNTEARMAGGDGVVVEPARASGEQVSRVDVASMLMGGVSRRSGTAAAVTGGPALISDPAHVRAGNGSLVARFARSLAAGVDGGLSLAGSGDSVLTWAHGLPGQGSLGMHGRKQAGALAVNLATGAVRPLDLLPPLIRLIHAAVMTAAVGVLLPAGILLARYRSKRQELKSGTSDEPDTALFRSHITVTMLALIMTGGAYGLGVWMTPPGAHFATWHHVLGHALMGGLLLQLALSMPCCRPERAPLGHVMTVSRGLWQLAHMLLGYPAALLGAAVIVLGLMAMDAGVVYYVVYGLVVLELVAFTAYRECGRRLCCCCMRSWRKVCCGCCVCCDWDGASSSDGASRRGSQASAWTRRGSTASAVANEADPRAAAGDAAFKRRYDDAAAVAAAEGMQQHAPPAQLPPGMPPYGFAGADGPTGLHAAAGMSHRGDALGAYYLDADEVDPALAEYLRAGGRVPPQGGLYHNYYVAPPPSATSAPGFGTTSAGVYSGASWAGTSQASALQVPDACRRGSVVTAGSQTPRSEGCGAAAGEHGRTAVVTAGRARAAAATGGEEDLRDSLRIAERTRGVSGAPGAAAPAPAGDGGAPLAPPSAHGVNGGEPKPIPVLQWSAIWRRFVASPLAEPPRLSGAGAAVGAPRQSSQPQAQPTLDLTPAVGGAPPGGATSLASSVPSSAARASQAVTPLRSPAPPSAQADTPGSASTWRS
jgi:hypothetical protein